MQLVGKGGGISCGVLHNLQTYDAVAKILERLLYLSRVPPSVGTEIIKITVFASGDRPTMSGTMQFQNPYLDPYFHQPTLYCVTKLRIHLLVYFAVFTTI